MAHQTIHIQLQALDIHTCHQVTGHQAVLMVTQRQAVITTLPAIIIQPLIAPRLMDTHHQAHHMALQATVVLLTAHRPTDHRAMAVPLMVPLHIAPHLTVHPHTEVRPQISVVLPVLKSVSGNLFGISSSTDSSHKKHHNCDTFNTKCSLISKTPKLSSRFPFS